MGERLLVVTNRHDDAHADALFRRYAQIGRNRAIRLNTEDFLQNAKVSFDGENFRIFLKDSGILFTSQEIGAVWYRRPMDLVPHESILDEGARQFCLDQGGAFLRSLYFATHDSAFWVNPLPCLHRARHKLPQLRAAGRVGFAVPPTLVTNEPLEALRFVQQWGTVCVKSLTDPNFTLKNKIYPWLTRILKADEIEEYADTLRLCPVLLQQFIPKRADVRVVVMGEHVFAVAIHSQELEASRSDVRGVAPEYLRHEVHCLPSEVLERILMFTRSQGLAFSSIDLLLSDEGEYIFLENNPNGQWLWLEAFTGLPLLDTFLGVLEEGAGRCGRSLA